MKKTTLLGIGILTGGVAGHVFSASSDFAGSFKGEETLVVSRCIQKTVSSPWKTTFVVDGDGYTGEGTSPSGGTFQFTGAMVEGIGQGTVEGRSPEGNRWEGRTRSSVTSDGELWMQIDGKVPVAGCDIAVRITARKDRP